ncbi:hypothetical protein GCM10010168_46820 [Actinoplanes ianthinogenes]|uniref:Concanavalin A-like lectin/glucanase superfamily protein n=1 Tax=Actinoplanes ianthinogenes TaxID=122358 RepID=A0ABM7LP17_9ACTN|nr:hypothetical protein [Actinoplanes ianthinogenes]BCJ41019.1 hypothetical protein Aiant_16760 [Actinoplanes ianthinogenes]GGR23465.1 hypothetical protein GCM10010168_46820 [Actinoplanes ianthinogenes]
MALLRTTLGALCAAVLTATPALAAPPPGHLELQYFGDLTDPSHVADSSGNHLDGAILGGAGGFVTSVTEPDGNRILRFPGGSCTTAVPCPQAIIRPSSTVTLVPGDDGEGRFVYGADVRLTETPSPDAGMNVFQFGAAGAGLSQWKLQVDYGRPSCRWSDGSRFVLLPAGPDDFTMTVGRWYRVTCIRLSPVLFQIRVHDPLTGRQLLPPAQQTSPLADILPSGFVVIGGKRINAAQTDVDTDQFHGDLDNVEFGRKLVPADAR